jgi:hypothetical protein
MSAISFAVDDIVHPEPLVWAYDPAGNADAELDSDGTTIAMDRPVPTPMFVADLDGVNETDADEWRTTVTLTVRDADGLPVSGATVYGTWSYGSSTNCTTDAAGQCVRVSSWQDGSTVSAISFAVDDVTHPEPLVWAYDPMANADPDGDSDGTTIVMERPVPTPMYVVDLDGVNSTNGSKWRTNVTVTVRDAGGQPVAAAKVYGTWSYSSGANCTTDTAGQCSLLSSEFESAEMSAISFAVDDVTHPEPLVWAYDPTGNADPDGDSDGTTILVAKP